MSTSAEVLNGRIQRAIEVVRSALKGLPEGDGGVSTFQVVTVLTDVEEALLGISDAPDNGTSGAIQLHQGPPISVATRLEPDAETVAPSIPVSDVESTIDQEGDFVIGEAPEPGESPEPKEKKEEERPADKPPGKHRSQTLAELARQKSQKFHAARAKAAKAAQKSSKDDSEQTTAQRIRAAQRATGL
jgi:hypothetical protein